MGDLMEELVVRMAKEAAELAVEWPIRFKGWWQDGDQEDEGFKEPWETFQVMVYGEEAGDMRQLLPADVPALLAALGIERK